eukprot:scaffold52170_cov63-Phaeocystis_antarctica.AAC.8
MIGVGVGVGVGVRVRHMFRVGAGVKVRDMLLRGGGEHGAPASAAGETLWTVRRRHRTWAKGQAKLRAGSGCRPYRDGPGGRGILIYYTLGRRTWRPGQVAGGCSRRDLRGRAALAARLASTRPAPRSGYWRLLWGCAAAVRPLRSPPL